MGEQDAAVQAVVRLRVAAWKDYPRDIREAIGHPQCVEVREIAEDGTVTILYRSPE